VVLHGVGLICNRFGIDLHTVPLNIHNIHSMDVHTILAVRLDARATLSTLRTRGQYNLCCRGVGRVLQGCYKGSIKPTISYTVAHAVLKSSLRCYNSVTTVLQECYKSVTRVLQEFYKSFTRGAPGIALRQRRN
jgi:predicted transcriptional regulator